MLILHEQCQYTDCNTGDLIRCHHKATASINMEYKASYSDKMFHNHLDMCQDHADKFFRDTLMDDGDHSHLEVEYEHGFKLEHDTDKHVFATASWETKPVPVAA